MTDDQLWQQQQDAQRFARERAQQLETEGIERLEQERIERDQLEEEERLYREERAQNRRETENGRSAEESERGTGRPLSLLSGLFGLMRRQHKAYRPVVPELQESHRSHSDDEGSPNNDTATAPVAPIVPPMHIIPGDETAGDFLDDRKLVNALSPSRGSCRHSTRRSCSLVLRLINVARTPAYRSGGHT